MNADSMLVPFQVVNRAFNALTQNDSGDSNDVQRYARYQALTEDDAKKLVALAYDRSYIQYGADSPDFPLCLDFARVCVGDCLRAAIKLGLAARPAIFVLEYTKTTGKRHAIVAAYLDTGRVIYYEPQTGEWMEQPVDVGSLDGFWV